MLFSSKLLWKIRNNIPIDFLIQEILALPCKFSEGYLRFLCPKCQEFRTACNANTNLARCFLCKENFNTIDIVILVKQYSFIQAIRFLIPILIQQQQSTV